MTRRTLPLIVGSLVLAAGCGSAPSSPSALPATTATAAAQTAVTSAVTQAVSQAAILAPTSGDAQNGLTVPCPDGGTMTFTFTSNPPADRSAPLSVSSRMEFNACRFQSVTMNGDPYLQTSTEITSVVSNGEPLPISPISSGITRTTGGLRFESGGTQGRAQYDCTQTISIQYNGGDTPQVSIASSGTVTWEQPLGSAPRSIPCGPSR